MNWSPTHICEDCGEEIERGILNLVNHHSLCKRNAPNSDIEKHWRDEEWFKEQKERERLQKIEDKKFAKIYQKMTSDEQWELLCLSCCGYWDGGMMLMGHDAFMRYHNFKDSMTKKYQK